MKKLGAILEEAGVIDEIQLVRALSHQRKWKCKLGKSLVDLGFVTEEVIAKTLAQQLGFQYRPFEPSETPVEILEQIPKAFAVERGLFPVGYAPGHAHKTIQIAISDPADKDSVVELEKITNLRLAPVMSTDTAIGDALRAWDRLLASNPRSAPTESPPFVKTPHGEPGPESLLESADILEEEWNMEVSIAKSVEPPPEEQPRRPAPPPIPKIDATSGSVDPIISISDLDDIDEQEIPEVEHTEAWEQAMPDAPTEIQELPAEDEPELVTQLNHSDPWEHIMPGTDAAADLVPEIDSVPIDDEPGSGDEGEITHEQPFETIMPSPPPPSAAPQLPPRPNPSAKTPTPPPIPMPVVKTPTPAPFVKDPTPAPAPKPKSATPPPMPAREKTPPPVKTPTPAPVTAKAKTPPPAPPPAPVTLDEISGELQTLKGQVGMLIDEIKSLKDELKRK